MAYRRATWNKCKFPNVNFGEDDIFLKLTPGKISVKQYIKDYVGFIHETNTIKKRTNGASWEKVQVDLIKTMINSL
jgi:hypothetical protein